MAKLRHGIIGCGGISGKHMQGYGALADRVDIYAACDLIPERAQYIADEHGAKKTYTDYRELLADPDVDFVSVCLPNHLHKEVSVAAMRAGKHVHCEKPMAMNYAETQEMLAVQKETGRQMMVGLNNRFTPWAQFAKDYVDGGGLGEIYYAKCGWQDRNMLPPSGWFTDVSKAGGGALIDVGVHFIDLAMYMMGYPEMQSVTGRTFSRIIDVPEYRQLYAAPGVIMGKDDVFDVEELAVGMMNLAGGRSISFELSWASNIAGPRLFYELYGTKGGLKFENDGITIYTTAEGQMVDITPSVAAELYSKTEFSVLVDAIEGKGDTGGIPQQASLMMKLIDAVYASSKAGKSIDLA